ncbi:hypothetical protein [Microbispora sp. NPDC049125]|uniref:hypothetical protein n=1 Tax=Microbispora sp. NPDC049125 TaxID=3154929 RepID=UPI003466748D
MPGHLLHLGAAVSCAHGGQALPTRPEPRVLVGGQPVTTAAAPYSVIGCSFTPPQGNGPCVTGQWPVSAVRVRAGGAFVLLSDSRGQCVPTGTPLTVLATQVRVKGT